MDKVNRIEALDLMGQAELTGVLATDLRYITLDFESGSSHTHIIHMSEIDTFVEATMKLHFSPGINPVSKEKTARIWRIRSSKLVAHGGYWWADPSLEGGKESTPMIISEGLFEVLWYNPNFDNFH